MTYSYNAPYLSLLLLIAAMIFFAEIPSSIRSYIYEGKQDRKDFDK